jgi:hypothetical protein
MNSRIGLLAGIVCVQVLIIAYLLYGQGSGSEEKRQLIDAAVGEIQRVDIADSDNEVVLELREGRWRVAGFAADEQKIKSILDKLAGLTATWPVASSASAAERFETDAEGFQRRVRLKDSSADGADGVLAELFFGTSPGYQRVHARAAGSNEVYSVELSNYELGVKVDDWLDKTVFALDDAPTAVSVTFADGSQPQALLKVEDGWTINGAAAVADEATTYANRYTTLRVLGLASEEDVARASEVAKLSVDADGEQIVLVIARLPDEGDYLLQNGQVEGHYRLATYIAEQLLMNDVEFTAGASETDDEPATDEAAIDASATDASATDAPGTDFVRPNSANNS